MRFDHMRRQELGALIANGAALIGGSAMWWHAARFVRGRNLEIPKTRDNARDKALDLQIAAQLPALADAVIA